MEFDDNYQLDPDSPGHVVGSITGLAAAIAAKARTYVINLDGSVSLRKFGGPGASSDLDGVFPYVSLGFTKGTKLTDYTLSTSFRLQDASTAEFDDTGMTNVDGDRLTFATNAGIVHQVDRLNSIIFSANATVVDFTEDATSLIPYFDGNTSLGWKRMVTPRTSVTLTGSAGYYRADDSPNTESWIFGADIDVTHKLTRRTSVSGGIGVNHVETDRKTGDESKTGFSGNLSFDHQRKRTRVYVNFSHALEPSSDGEIEYRTRAEVGFNHQITRRAAFSMSAAYGLADSLNGGSKTRQTVSVSPLFTYIPARNWQTSLGYLFRYSDDDGAARSHKVFFNVSKSFTQQP